MTNTTEFGHGTFKLGGTEFICQVTSWRYQPSNNRRDIVTPCGTTSRYINERGDVLVEFLQDWTAGGISKYLWDNYNVSVTFEFSPDPDLTPKLTGNLICPRPLMGGGAQDVLTDSVSCPVEVVPTLTADV